MAPLGDGSQVLLEMKESTVATPVKTAGAGDWEAMAAEASRRPRRPDAWERKVHRAGNASETSACDG